MRGRQPHRLEDLSSFLAFVLLLWFYLTGIAILVGGEVNSETERACAGGGERPQPDM